MASILKVGDKWRAQVRRTGHKSIAKSFDTKKAAEEWGRKVEREIDVDDYLDGRTAITLEVVINRYLEEMKHSANTKGMLNQISRGIGNLTLDQLTSAIAFILDGDRSKASKSLSFISQTTASRKMQNF